MRKTMAVWTVNVGEPASPQELADALTRYGVQGATIIPALGLWQGKVEQSNVVQIGGIDEQRVRELAGLIRDEFAQQAVYVQHGDRAFLV